MAQLSAQSISRLCKPTKWLGLREQQPMIVPFVPEKVVTRGKSFGLSSASYDVRIAHDLTLGVNPGVIVEKHFRRYGLNSAKEHVLQRALADNEPYHALAHTVENFFIPDNVVGYVCDKSSYARVFVTAFNTLFDPGFQGNATLELVNLGYEPVEIKAGDPICQFTFHWLDKKTDRPYRGKYQHQKKVATPARFDNGDGSWT